MENRSSASDSDNHGTAERTREQAFYTYYEPFCQLTGDVPFINESGPRLTSDAALAAFAQLGALKLNARRAIISFFDRENQYILAEATQSLSLRTGVVEEAADELWLGIGKFPRGDTMCEATASVEGHDHDARKVPGRPPIVVIPDLSRHEVFKHKAFVRGKPHLRFYAGVPIVTAKGNVIGSYCVLDEEPRERLLPWQMTFLEDMALTVVAHLEMVRATAENARSQRMIRGLSSFIKGSSSLEDWWNTSKNRPHMPQEIPSASEVATLDDYPGTSKRDPASQDRKESDSGATLSKPDQLHSPIIQTELSPTDMAVTAWMDHVKLPDGPDGMRDIRKPSRETSTLQEEALSSQVRRMFDRATEILRGAVDLDGAMFVDASVNSFGGLVELSSNYPSPGVPMSPAAQLHSSQGHGDDDPSTHTSASGPEVTDVSAAMDADKPATILGLSSLDNSQTLTAQPPSISEQFLRALLRRYPKGKTWRFDTRSFLGEPPREHEPVPYKASTEKIFRKGWHVYERRMLERLFPGVRYLALVGLWDSHRDRWFAASIIWTRNPIRMFSKEFELPFLTSFGDSIMAEVARLDFNLAERAKTDLLSGISHELRSPLHGVLGCIECLHETNMTSFQDGLVDTIETCGRTLLDAIDHLLDHARINFFPQDSKNRQGSVDKQGSEGTQDALQQTSQSLARAFGPSLSLLSDVDLSLLSEEVLETLVEGFNYDDESNHGNASTEPEASFGPGEHVFPRKSGQVRDSIVAGKKSSVKVVLDLERGKNSHWIFRIQPGAWRRLLLNLVSNSLKHTEQGFIRVRLSAAPMSLRKPRGPHEVVMTVTDSGSGIGEDFLKNKLFSPFSKENPLTPGTGLGMSIVKDIVERLGGRIAVDSARNSGTEVRVIIPDLTPVNIDQVSRYTPFSDKFSGLHFNFFGVGLGNNVRSFRQGRDSANGWNELEHGIAATCLDWFGIDVKFSEKPQNADVYLTSASAIREIVASGNYLEDASRPLLFEKPLIVVCDAISSAHYMAQSGVALRLSRFVQYVPQPHGPRKMRKAFSVALESMVTESDINVLETGAACNFDQDFTGADMNLLEQPQRLPARPATQSRDTPPPTPDSDVLESFHGIRPVNEHSKSQQVLTLSELSRPQVLRSFSTAVLDAKNKTPSSAAGARSLSNGLNLLLVDDNPINLRLLVTYAKKHHHAYQTATNGLEALERYRLAVTTKTSDQADGTTVSQSFDYIFMDLSMPVMNGLESTRRIRGFEHSSGLRRSNIIALTAMASANAQQEAYSSGVDLFMTKPVRLKHLTEILDKHGTSRERLSARMGA